MKIIFSILIGFLLMFPFLYAQDMGYIIGMVTDSTNNIPLPGAAIILETHSGTTTGPSGEYILSVRAGWHLLNVRYVGYQSKSGKVLVSAGDTITVNFKLVSKREVLNEVVVSAEKFSQKLSDVNVSMSVLKPREMEFQNAVSLDEILNKTSGFDILDGQPGIRGGGGFSYGAGSRVLVVLDGLPLISGDAGDVKWDYLPLETLSQVEIIKGASSVLYGSSALNGVVNLRTIEPGLKPVSQTRAFTGLYLSPRRKELIWWDTPRWIHGVSFSHTGKIGNLDLVGGLNLIHDKGYRKFEYKKNARMNLNLRYRLRKINGLSFGVNTNGMILDKSSFFLWENADSGAYRQNLAGASSYTGYRVNIDPYIQYHSSEGGAHVLKTRWFSVANNMPGNPDKNNHFDLFMCEYRYQRDIFKQLRITAGVFENYGIVRSRLYGEHLRNEAALYAQLHGTLGATLNFTIGSRWETYWLDKQTQTSVPVFRTGINYRLFPHTNIRLSAGQGYRYPSVAEKFTATSIGALNVFPNPALLPEKGWSAEVGLMQGFRLGSWKGYLDLALFRNDYTDMIEFTFGLYLPDTVQVPSWKYVGFKAINVGRARITGSEITAHIEKNTGKLHFLFQGGYTWLNPVDLNISVNDSVDNILKYRYRHGIKGNADVQWKGVSAGVTFVYRSFMERVDSVFTDPAIGNLILPGYPEYRQEHHHGNWVFDVRAGYQIAAFVKMSLICKNLFNREYMGRPGDIRPNRSVALQLLFRW
ncbi:MAG TPA: TonB-dependent receptor [Bacteroidetes bacterium]|nr:TonB-dependent receptor [Bacteroidota bacterium]